MGISLIRVVREARACRLCEKELPQEPRPIFRAARGARLLIVGQAPGRRAHLSGIPWNDPSGDVLRGWLGLDRDSFYDDSRIAIVPVGLCYPGTVGSADLPPRPECAPLWQPKFRAALPRVRLTLLVGRYAQNYYLSLTKKPSLSGTVRAYHEYLPEYFPLPHPSWRNLQWLKKNPWFEREVIPALKERVRACIAQV
jgi:uracil-DNA glycosylase